MKKIRNFISKIVISLVICALVIVAMPTKSYAYSLNFSADKAKGYVSIQGETYYVEKDTLPNGQVNVSVKDSNNMITEAQTFGDTVQIQEKRIVQGKKQVVSTRVISTHKVKAIAKDVTKSVHANAATLTASKYTAAGYSYDIYSDKSWICSNDSYELKYVRYTSSTKSNLENFRTCVNSARTYELKILSSGTSALLGIAVTVATAGAAAIIAAIVGGGGTLTTVNYVIDYGAALDNCKYYYNLL